MCKKFSLFFLFKNSYPWYYHYVRCCSYFENYWVSFVGWILVNFIRLFCFIGGTKLFLNYPSKIYSQNFAENLLKWLQMDRDEKNFQKSDFWIEKSDFLRPSTFFFYWIFYVCCFFVSLFFYTSTKILIKTHLKSWKLVIIKYLGSYLQFFITSKKTKIKLNKIIISFKLKRQK